MLKVVCNACHVQRTPCAMHTMCNACHVPGHVPPLHVDPLSWGPAQPPVALQVCPARPARGSFSVPRCEACAESFMDLEYLLRRDSLAVAREGHRKKWNERPQAAGFRSGHHVALRLNELCDSTEQRHVQGMLLVLQCMATNFMPQRSSPCCTPRASVPGGIRGALTGPCARSCC